MTHIEEIRQRLVDFRSRKVKQNTNGSVKAAKVAERIIQDLNKLIQLGEV